MKRTTQAIRTPIRRQHAESYMLITIMSFAASVSVTRLFLYLTGYPQIGGGELHIAHVLWGGLLLFVAALLPQLLANRWVYIASSILSGVGVGLFIDEVGKFITRSNDYFYPWAAPIIYVFFLLVVVLYLRIKQPTREDFRADLYYILEDLQEVLDHDLSQREQADIISHLERVKRLSKQPDLVDLANHIEEFINSQNLVVAPDEPGLLERMEKWLRVYEKKWLTRTRYRAVLSGALTAIAVWTLYYPFYIMTVTFSTHQLEPVLLDLMTNRFIQTPNGVSWFLVMLALELSVGVMLMVSAVMLAIGREKRAFWLASTGLIFSISIVNVLVFYFDQFSTIINSIMQFLVFLLVLRYRHLFLKPKPDLPPL